MEEEIHTVSSNKVISSRTNTPKIPIPSTSGTPQNVLPSTEHPPNGNIQIDEHEIEYEDIVSIPYVNLIIIEIL